MIITIYPSRCTLYQGDYVPAEWVEHRFRERPKLAMRTEAGLVKVREPLPPVAVKVHLATLSGDGKWITLADGHRYDAGHLLCMARIGKKGMSIIGTNY